jgi:hypothetical protein
VAEFRDSLIDLRRAALRINTAVGMRLVSEPRSHANPEDPAAQTSSSRATASPKVCSRTPIFSIRERYSRHICRSDAAE